MREPKKNTAAASAATRLLLAGLLFLDGSSAATDSGRSLLEASIREPSALRGHGCKFVPSLCGNNEICFDDNLFGSCQRSLDSTVERWRAPEDDDLRETLEGILSELVPMGYSWRDSFTQCVVDAALLAYRLRARATVRASTCVAFARAADRRALLLHQQPSAPGGADHVRTQALRSRNEDRSQAIPGRSLPPASAAAAWPIERMRVVRPGPVEALPLSQERLSVRRMKEEEAKKEAALKERLLRTGLNAERPTGTAEAALLSPWIGSDAASRRFEGSFANVPSPAAAEVDLESLLLRLLTGELTLKQVPLDVTNKLADYIGAILQEVQEREHEEKAENEQRASSSVSFGDAARQFLPPSKLSAAGAEIAKTAEGMANDVNGGDGSSSLGIVSSINRKLPVVAGRQRSTENENDRGSLLAKVNEPSAPFTVQYPSAAQSAVVTGLRKDDSKSLLKNATSSGSSQSESYAWMILSPSISGGSAHQLAETLNGLLKAANNTSIVEVRVDHNAILVETPSAGTDPQQLYRLADIIEEHKEAIEKDLGISIMKSGHDILSSANLRSPSSELLANFTAYALPAAANQTRRHMFIAIFALCGAAVGVGGALAVICVIRRCQHGRGWKLTRGKDYLLSSDEADDETRCLTHDYEELVRQHIHSKSSEQSDSPTSSVDGCNASPNDELDAGAGGRRSARSSQSSWSEEPAVCSMDVSTGHMILSYMEDHLKNKDRLEDEWQALCSYRADLGGMDIAALPKNKKKNRLQSILPYDHNRVVLDETKNISGDDYINASFVADHHPRTASYIATQGPMATTVADFWQMVWERGTVVIVMLTRLSENVANGAGSNGSAQCHRYWPNGSSELYHIYEVHLVSEHVWCDDYLVRSFYLKNLETNETRTVTQFHFLAWPDGGIPSSTKTLLDFRRKMNKSYRGRSCPIAVVCSNGAGRSGAFILLDMVINRLCKGAKEIDIAATLEHIRDQRMAAVQTKEQFEFVLSSIAEEVQAMLMSA